MKGFLLAFVALGREFCGTKTTTAKKASFGSTLQPHLASGRGHSHSLTVLYYFLFFPTFFLCSCTKCHKNWRSAPCAHSPLQNASHGLRPSAGFCLPPPASWTRSEEEATEFCPPSMVFHVFRWLFHIIYRKFLLQSTQIRAYTVQSSAKIMFSYTRFRLMVV